MEINVFTLTNFPASHRTNRSKLWGKLYWENFWQMPSPLMFQCYCKCRNCFQVVLRECCSACQLNIIKGKVLTLNYSFPISQILDICTYVNHCPADEFGIYNFIYSLKMGKSD